MSDVLFHKWDAAVVLPSGFTQKRRLGQFLRLGATILTFAQFGDYFGWGTARLDVSGVTYTTSQTSVVPLGVVLRELLCCCIWRRGVNWLVHNVLLR